MADRPPQGKRVAEAIAVEGLQGLQRALRRGDSLTGRLVRKEMLEIASDVRMVARSYVTHTTGRHGGPDVPPLGPSIRTSVTQTGATVYSNAPHAWVQDRGGQVGRNHATILKRSDVSHYMTEAVRDSGPYVTKRMEAFLDELERDWPN